MSDLVLLNHVTTPAWWAPVVQLQRDDVAVTHLDVPGFGDAPAPSPPSLRAMARGLSDTLEERGLSAAHVVGISMAGSVALELARVHGCGRVTAISPPGFWTAAQAAVVMTKIGSLWSAVRLGGPLVELAGRSQGARARVWREVVAHPERVPPEVADEMILGLAHRMRHLTTNPRALAAASRAIVAYRVAPLDGAVPVTVAWGDRDRFTSYRTQASKARRVLRHARHVTLHGCGHIPTYDDPDQVAQLFVGELRPTRRQGCDRPGSAPATGSSSHAPRGWR